MIKAVESNITASGNLQTNFFNAQRAVLETISALTKGAGESAKTIQESLKQLQNADIDAKIQKVDETVKRISGKEQVINETSAQLTALTTQTQGLAKELSGVKSIQSGINRARLNELVLMKTNDEHTTLLRDPDSNNAYTIKFSISGIGSRKTLKIDMHAVSSETLTPTESSVEVNVDEEKRAPKAHPIKGTPFSFKFDFAYHAVLADDFIALRVIPQS